jgi:hypothetical protein
MALEFEANVSILEEDMAANRANSKRTVDYLV